MLKSEINSREKEEKSERPREQLINTRLRFKVRFDYKGKPRPARFFFGGRRTESVAQEFREQQVALWRNVPLQGIYVENMDLGEIYSVYDDEMDEEIAFAPLELMVSADSLDDLLRFIVREEFRRIEILEPGSIILNGKEIERLLFKINELFQNRLLLRLKESSR
ncbi:MAG: hypothetical protein C4554_10380 [Dethiobacter sp.]|jgi:hypothetical protein|nr:MAG: hypothetical protein C4554_10380 [Dethiobacter sp.]